MGTSVASQDAKLLNTQYLKKLQNAKNITNLGRDLA